jgi:hypothetical protein
VTPPTGGGDEGGEDPVTPPAGGAAWSHTFAKDDLGSSYSSSKTVTLNGVDWDFTMEGSTYLGFDNNNGRGLQIGKSKEPASEIVLSTSGISGNITKIVLNTSGASGTDAMLVVKVGDGQFGNSIKATTTATDYTLEGVASGKVELRWTLTKAAAVYIKSIAIYTE